MNLLKLMGSKPNTNRSAQRKISTRRIYGRRLIISQWALEAQKCDIAISKVDEKLSALTGPFVRAAKERLEAKRLELTGKLNIALSHLKKQKALMGNNIKHNQELTTRRLG